MFHAMNHVCATPLPWRIVLPLQYENCAVAVAQFSRCRERTVREQRENFPTAVAELCAGSQRTLPPQRQNCVTLVENA